MDKRTTESVINVQVLTTLRYQKSPYNLTYETDVMLLVEFRDRPLTFS